MGLAYQAQDNDARKFGWRIGSDVREIQVKRDKRPALATADVDHPLIKLAAQSLLCDRMGIVPGHHKKGRERRR